jgi:hypothetical protein
MPPLVLLVFYRSSNFFFLTFYCRQSAGKAKRLYSSLRWRLQLYYSCSKPRISRRRAGVSVEAHAGLPARVQVPPLRPL